MEKKYFRALTKEEKPSGQSRIFSEVKKQIEQLCKLSWRICNPFTSRSKKKFPTKI